MWKIALIQLCIHSFRCTKLVDASNPPKYITCEIAVLHTSMMYITSIVLRNVTREIECACEIYYWCLTFASRLLLPRLRNNPHCRRWTNAVSNSQSRAIQQTGDVGPMAVYCWPNVADVRPTLNRHRLSVSCLLWEESTAYHGCSRDKDNNSILLWVCAECHLVLDLTKLPWKMKQRLWTELW